MPDNNCRCCAGLGYEIYHCSNCNGSGEGHTDGEQCIRCKGTGTIKVPCYCIEEDTDEDL
jgi:hypothetical protein